MGIMIGRGDIDEDCVKKDIHPRAWEDTTDPMELLYRMQTKFITQFGVGISEMTLPSAAFNQFLSCVGGMVNYANTTSQPADQITFYFHGDIVVKKGKE